MEGKCTIEWKKAAECIVKDEEKDQAEGVITMRYERCERCSLYIILSFMTIDRGQVERDMSIVINRNDQF